MTDPDVQTPTPKTSTDARTPTVLTIAGSDPSGGAGIQADLKTFATAGVYGASVITALTAQNTRTVSGVMAVPVDFVKQQLDAVLEDIRIDVIKLGMLPNAGICEIIAPYLAQYPVVCDPVMVSTSGCSLIDSPAVAALVTHILPVSDFLTPNADELVALYGATPLHPTSVSPVQMGHELMARFKNLSGLILKGGHMNPQEPEVTDILLLKKKSSLQEFLETSPRYFTRNTHGTGCTFASAFAAFLAQHNDPARAFSRAVAFTSRLINVSRNAGIGRGNGPLLHHHREKTAI